MTPEPPSSPVSQNSEALPAGPPPSFDRLPLSDELRRALGDMGYVEPTPVQLAVYEPAVSGRDVVVQARTGTGKTAAFGIPIIDRLVRRSARGVQALVLCPTRELALQVTRELEQLGTHRKVTPVAIYGGASMSVQVDALERGAAVVVGTPGRVLDHLKRGTLDPASVRVLVLDESDEMLSMGFEKELTAILDRLPAERQTLLFSATLPADIERIVRTRLKQPEFVLLSGDHVGALGIDHYVYLVQTDKLGALVSVLEVEDPESALVFCNTREQTEVVATALQRHGFGAAWLNGDLPQSEREKVMAATRAGELRFLVATDVAARGIDVSHLTHVINYDFPQVAEGYVHRTGRTGRAGRIGTAISLLTAQDVGPLYLLRLTYGIRPVERHLPTEGEQRTRMETDVVDELARTFAPRGQAPEHRSLARRLLSHDDGEAIVAGMLREILGAQPGLSEQSAARRRAGAARVTPPATRVEPEPQSAPPARLAERVDERAGSDGEQEERSGCERPPSPPAAQDTANFVELYVNVGRKEGIRPRDLKALLHDDGGLPHEQVGRLRIRDRCAFVEVAPEVVERAIALLERGKFGDRVVAANISERSARGPATEGD